MPTASTLVLAFSMCFYVVGSMLCDICPGEFGSNRSENDHRSHPAMTLVFIYFPRFFFEELLLCSARRKPLHLSCYYYYSYASSYFLFTPSTLLHSCQLPSSVAISDCPLLYSRLVWSFQRRNTIALRCGRI